MSDGSPNRGMMIVLAYLWLLALVPLVVEKQDAEIQWHARNGIVLMVAEIVALGAYVAFTTLISLACSASASCSDCCSLSPGSPSSSCTSSPS